MQSQVEHFSPEIRDLLVTNPFFPSHVRARDQALPARVLPMRLPAHAAHNPVRIKREIANGEDSFLFGLKIFRDRRTMRPRKRGVSNEIEIWFGAASDHGQASRNPVAAFCLDIPQ